MRKYLILLGLILSLGLYGQYEVDFDQDTVDAAETVSLAIPKGTRNLVSYDFQIWTTRIKGADTIPIILQESVNGVNYYPIDTINVDSATTTSGVLSGVLYSGFMRFTTGGSAGDTLTLDGKAVLKTIEKSGFERITLAIDTATNTETVTVPYTKKISDCKNVSFQVIGTELSGSNSCVVTLQESNDNSHWNTLAGQSTLALTNASGNIVWNLTDMKPLYIRANCVCTGTHTTEFKGYLLPKLRD